MEENQQLSVLMAGLRGSNMNAEDFADDKVQMRLVEVNQGGDCLPLVYDPDTIRQYWSKRPVAVVKRALQLLSKFWC